MLKESIADQKIFFFNEKKDSAETEIKIKLHNGKSYVIHNAFKRRNDCLDEYFSLIEFKSFYTEYIQILEAERFLQYIMLLEVYPEELGWKQEEKHDINNKRIDLINTSKIKGKEHVFSLIENKNFTLGNMNEYEEKKHEAFTQITNYISSLQNLKEDYSFPIIGSQKSIPVAILIYDGRYFFNNPNELNSIRSYFEYNTDFFKTLNYEATITGTNVELKPINEQGIISKIKVDNHITYNGSDVVNVITDIDTLRKLSTETNPRDLDLEETISLAASILKDIQTSLDNGFIYEPQAFTTEKTIGCKNKLYIFNTDNLQKSEAYVFGVGMSLDNGQHSVNAYYFVQDLFRMNRESFKQKYSDLELDNVIKLYDLLEEYKEDPKFEAIMLKMTRLLIKSKIIVSKNKVHYNLMRYANNNVTKAEMPSNNFNNLKSIFFIINRSLYSDNIQIKIPKIEKISNCNYLNEQFLDNLIHIYIEGNKDPLEIYRKKMNKQTRSSFYGKILKQNKIATMKNALKNLQKEASELNNAQKEFQESIDQMSSQGNSVTYLINVRDDNAKKLMTLQTKISQKEKEIYNEQNSIYEPKEDELNDFIAFLKEYKHCIYSKEHLGQTFGGKEILRKCFVIHHLEKLKSTDETVSSNLSKITENLFLIHDTFSLYPINKNSILDSNKDLRIKLQQAIYKQALNLNFNVDDIKKTLGEISKEISQLNN